MAADEGKQEGSNKPMKWYAFDKSKGSHQKRPEIKKLVLILCHSTNAVYPDPIVVGYRKDAAGDKQCPYFVKPGCTFSGEPYAWCDCLPDNMKWPLPDEEQLLKQQSETFEVR